MPRILTPWLLLRCAWLSFHGGLAKAPAVAAVPAAVHPLRFVPNQRQWKKPVLFAADVPAGWLFLERGRLLPARYAATTALNWGYSACPDTLGNLYPASQNLWAGYPTTPGATAPRVMASPAATPKYYGRVSTAAGCTRHNSVAVPVAAPPLVTLRTDKLITLPGEDRTFTASSPVPLSGHRWDFGNGQTSLQASPAHAYTTPGSYTVRLQATYGSGYPAEARFVVTVATPRDFKYPNVITPNRDGLNDTFRPYVSAEPVTLQIFSRWGRKVFEAANYTDGWGDDPTLAAGLY